MLGSLNRIQLHVPCCLARGESVNTPFWISALQALTWQKPMLASGPVFRIAYLQGNVVSQCFVLLCCPSICIVVYTFLFNVMLNKYKCAALRILGFLSWTLIP